MRLAAVPFASLALLLAASGSPAQSPASQAMVSKPAAPRIIVRPGESVTAAQSRSCPVSLDVRHGSAFGQAVAIGGMVRRPAGQALDVTVMNQGSREIASLDVIVQVHSGKSRMLPLVNDVDDLGERLPLHINLGIKADENADSSWTVASTDAVAYIELSRVTYRDGSSWSAAKTGTCQFTPDPMMLISLR